MAVQSVVKRSRRRVSMNAECSPGELASPSWLVVQARG
jgi:hypothetical protein